MYYEYCPFFQEKFRKFTSPTMGRKNGDSPPIVSPPPNGAPAEETNNGDESSVYLEPEEKSLKELLVTALSPESLRRKSIDRSSAQNNDSLNSVGSAKEKTINLVRGGGGRVTGKTSPLKKKPETRGSPHADSAPFKRYVIFRIISLPLDCSSPLYCMCRVEM